MHGYGFPRWRGGPMFWADLVGLRTVHDALRRLRDEHGEWLEPAPLLARLAGSGGQFAALAGRGAGPRAGAPPAV